MANEAVITFGSVSVKVAVPSDSELKENIKAGQDALKRGKAALLKTGISLERKKGCPLYFGCEDRPGWMVRELNGKRTIGRFVAGKFVPERTKGNRKTESTTTDPSAAVSTVRT